MLKKFMCLVILSFLFTNAISAEGGGEKRTCYDTQEDKASNRRTSPRNPIEDTNEHFSKNETVSRSINFEDLTEFMEEFSRIIRETFPLLTFLNQLSQWKYK